MEKKKYNISIIKNIILISCWVFFLFVNELLIVSQLIERANETNMHNFILSMLFVFLIYFLGIALNVTLLIVEIKRKEPLKKNILSYVFQFLFVCAAFVTMFESSLDAKTTTVQVRKVLTFIQGNAFKIKLKSFDVVLNNPKEKYEIGEELSYYIDFKPAISNAKDLIYEVDNEIVTIDLVNNKIKCLANGECNITFYDATNKEVKSSLSLKIDTILLEEINLGEHKDIFLEVNEEYLLIPKLYPEKFQGEKVIFESSNNEVATVDENGNIKGLKAGHATITCKKDGIQSSVYVCVSPITSMSCSADKIVYVSSSLRQDLSIKFNDMDSYNSKYFKITHNSENIRVSYASITSTTNTLHIAISNKIPDNPVNEIVTVKFSYTYPGGYTLTDEVVVEVTSGYDLLVEEIDKTKTQFSHEVDLYYHKGALITKYYEIPVYYNVAKLSQKDLTLSKAVSDGDIDLSYSSYNNIVIGLNYVNDIKDFYTIKFYPSRNVDEFFEFAIKINKIEIDNLDSSFEMNRLYEKEEGKLNEIWPLYFNKELLEDITFTNPLFKNSGIKIIPVGNTLDYIDFEVSDFGIVKTFKLKNLTKYNTVPECVLEFDICSLYEYNENVNCKKYRYVINVRSEYDDLTLAYGDMDYTGEDFEINVLKGEVIRFSYYYPIELEYKGDFQKSLNRPYMISATINNSKVLKMNQSIMYETLEYGICEITFNFSKTLLSVPHTLVVTVNVVDENGVIPLPKVIDVTPITFDNVCKPNIEKGYFTIGSTIKFDLVDIFEYEFTSSNSSVVSLDEEGNATCVAPGKAVISATNKSNPTEVYFYTVNVYTLAPKVEIVKGDFFSCDIVNNHYKLIAKTNTAYEIKLSDSVTEVKFYETKDYENLLLSEDGTVVVTKAGTYYGYVLIGEEGSPYGYKLNFVIQCDDNGVSSNFLYLVRKSIGHFGLFMMISILCTLCLVLYRPRKWYVVLVNGLCISAYIFFIAYSSEFIQGLNPTRTNSFNDVMIDFSGGITGIVLVLVVFLIVILIKYIVTKFKKKKAKI